MESHNFTERKEKNNKYYSAGMKEYYRKNWLKAIEYLEKSLNLEEKHYRTYFTLGKCYLNIHKKGKAEELFKEVIELDQKNVYARLELGKLYAKQGREEEAEKLFKEYIQLDSKGLYARLELGKLYAKQGKEEESEKLFKEYIELDRKGLHPRLELGKLYAKQGKEEESEKVFKECIELDRKNVYARLELGKLYAKQGREEAAEKIFKECIELDRKGLHPRLELGKLYAKQGKEDKAEELFKEIIELDQKNVYTRLELGKLYAKQEEKKSIDMLFLEKKGENKKLQHIEDLKIREKIYLQKITEDDIESLKQLLEQHKDEKNFYLVLIAVYERMGQKQNALNVIKRMQQNGIEVKGISIIKERIKSNKARIYDIAKWDELIGWNVSLIECKKKEENNTTIENKGKEKLSDKEIPKSNKKENRGKKLEGENNNKYIILKGIKQESKGNTKTTSTSRVKKNKEKQAKKIGETIRENTKSAVNRIKLTYYAKMRLCSDEAEDIHKETERVRKYIKKYDKLQSILECSEGNKRAKMELMLVLMNEGYSKIVEVEYPTEYKFINSLVEEYKKKEKTADVVKKEIDEYCL